jgi:hypothetical protein
MPMKTLIPICLVFIGGCATPSDDKALQVKILEESSPLIGHCKNLGQVVANSPNLSKARLTAQQVVSRLGGDAMVVTKTVRPHEMNPSPHTTITLQVNALKCNR